MTVKRTSRWGVATFGVATATLTLGALASPVAADTPDQVERPDTFTSAFTVAATPEQVIGPDGTTPSGGQEGASGTFRFLVNSDDEVICWDITVEGLGDSDYESAAKTATHIHETAAGSNGPPRIAFPDPGPLDADVRTSSGCSEGPFTTGLGPDGANTSPDTGTDFTLAQLEDDPAGFSADTHTEDAVPGAVRGQLVFDPAALAAANGVDGDDDADDGAGDDTDADGDRQVPVGGVDTGAGGTASGTPVAPLAALMLGGLGAIGVVAARRRLGAGA